MTSKLTNILNKQYVELIISLKEKHLLTPERIKSLDDLFSENNNDAINQIKADLLVNDPNNKKDAAAEFAASAGIHHMSSEQKLNLAAALTRSDDGQRELLVSRVISIIKLCDAIKNGNCYLTIDANADISESTDEKKFKQANIADINNRVKLMKLVEAGFDTLHLPLFQREEGVFKENLNLSMVSLKRVRESVQLSKKIFPEDFVIAKFYHDIGNYLDKNHPINAREKL